MTAPVEAPPAEPAAAPSGRGRVRAVARRLTADRALAALVVGAAAVRALYWIAFLRDYVPRSDAAHYHEIARNLVEGQGFAHWFPQLELHATAFRPPLFPLLLSGIYAVTWPAVGIAQLLNLVIGCVVVGLTFVVVRDVGGRGAAVAAAAVVALYPPLIANDVVPLAESLALALLLALALAVRRGAYVWAGLLAGLLVLDRTSAQAVVVIVVVWVAVRLGVKRAVVTLLVAAAVVVPWVVRNAVQVGAPVLVTSNGFNLAAMHSEEARETGGFVDPVFDERFEEFRIYQFDEVEWDRKLRAHAMEQIRDDPLSVTVVARRNLLAIFELRPSVNESPERLDGRNIDFRTWTLPLFYVVTAVGLVGLWRHRRDPTVQFLALVTAYFVGLSLVFVAPPRLRAPLDLVCAIGAGLLLSRLAGSRRDRASAARPRAVGGGR